MNRDVPKSWVEISKEDFSRWLKTKAPNYRRSGWGNMVVYFRKELGEFDGDFACHLRNGGCYIDPIYLKG